jgi:CheY-like chemotaxis protein
VRLVAGQQVRALVVDDLEDNREVLSGFLERAGVQVATAEDGAAALDSIAANRPDIVFMDVRMPVMDGLTAVRELRARWSADPIVCVAITASGLLRQRGFYLDAGFDDFVAKPFRFETICDCIEHHLGVEFERLPDPAAAAESNPEEARPEAMHLPAALRKRLLEAAQVNALTEIEAVIAELKMGESGARVLAEELDQLLARYDTDGIIELVERLGADAGQPV